VAFRQHLLWIVGGAAPGAEWRGVARNEPMSGLLFSNKFIKIQISKRRSIQTPIKLFFWWWWFKLQFFLPHLPLSRLFYLFDSRNIYNEIYSSNLEIKSLTETSKLEIFDSNKIILLKILLAFKQRFPGILRD